MPLSQVQIIRSLAEALGWFEKELEWGVDPAELRHLTGRIGELYAAMITRGQMALATNQRGYDVVSAEGERISVKTVTSSAYISFRKSTLGEVQRAMILRIVIEEGEASIQELTDGSTSALIAQCRDNGPDFHFQIRRPPAAAQDVNALTVVARAAASDHEILQFENGTVVVDTAGVREPVAMPILRKLAAELGLSLVWGGGRVKNTRQLGADVIAALNAGTLEDSPGASASRFGR
jgi:pyruvate/2-oxoglutarate dehydrogenase complex dihydrolipoamide acyltransferase (E2) component